MIRHILRHWLPLAVVITGLAGLVYVVGQQVLRLSANDPQGVMAEDIATRLIDGEPVAGLVPTATVDVNRSWAPFIIVYDGQGKVIASSGQLNGQTPAIPAGVLDNANENGEDRVTWAPAPGLRLAAVVEQAGGPQAGYVLVARSLRDAEARIDTVGELVLAGWAATLLASLVAVVILEALIK